MDPAGIYHLELHPRFTLVISGFNNNSLFYVHIIHCSCRSSRGGGMCVYVCVGERGPGVLSLMQALSSSSLGFQGHLNVSIQVAKE